MHLAKKPLLFTLGLLLAGVAQAEPKLLSSSPAEGSTVQAPKAVELRFSEKLEPQHSGAKLVMTEMAGMAHASPMAVKARVAAGAEPGVMLITPASALTSGSYRVDWRAAGAQGQPGRGTLTFQVK